MSTPNPVPVTKETDPTLGLVTHAVSVAVGAGAAYLAAHFSVTFSASAQVEIVTAVATLVTTGVHYLMAIGNATKVTK